MEGTGIGSDNGLAFLIHHLTHHSALVFTGTLSTPLTHLRRLHSPFLDGLPFSQARLSTSLSLSLPTPPTLLFFNLLFIR